MVDKNTPRIVTNQDSLREDERIRITQQGASQLVADLSQVEFMSSAGLRAILAALKEARQHGGDLRLAAAQPGVEKILKISGFTSILKAYPSVDEALSSFTV